ncbi:hypothetical protein ACER0C_001427 [Sarotherodon galilaeus]
MSGFQALLFSGFSVLLFGPAVGQSEFTVSVEQDVYEAEENSNITMTWFFPVDTGKNPDLHVQNVKLETYIYSYSIGSDDKPYVHEIYRGRLQCDTQLATKGRLQCLLTHLRLSDTGTYQCIVVLNSNSSYKPCVLNVTAASEEPAEKTPKPASPKRIWIYLGVFALTLFALTSLALYSIFNKR